MFFPALRVAQNDGALEFFYILFNPLLFDICLLRLRVYFKRIALKCF